MGMAVYGRPKSEINFWESRSRNSPACHQLKCPLRRKLIAPRNSVACSCTQWRPPAAGGARLRLHHTRMHVAETRARVLHTCTRTRTYTRDCNGWTHGRNAHAIDPRFCAVCQLVTGRWSKSARYTITRGEAPAHREEENRRRVSPFRRALKPLLHGRNWAIHVPYCSRMINGSQTEKRYF